MICGNEVPQISQMSQITLRQVPLHSQMALSNTSLNANTFLIQVHNFRGSNPSFPKFPKCLKYSKEGITPRLKMVLKHN